MSFLGILTRPIATPMMLVLLVSCGTDEGGGLTGFWASEGGPLRCSSSMYIDSNGEGTLWLRPRYGIRDGDCDREVRYDVSVIGESDDGFVLRVTENKGVTYQGLAECDFYSQEAIYCTFEIANLGGSEKRAFERK